MSTSEGKMSFRGERLRERRKILKLSQAELAAKVNLDQQHISYLESGDANPTGTTLSALAQALEVTTDWLLGLTENAGKPIQEASDLDEFELQVLQLLRSKPPDKRKKILDVIRLLD